jgi:hypothetical protein
MAIFSNYLTLSVIVLEKPETFQSKGCFKDLSLDIMNGDKKVGTLKVRNDLESNQRGVFSSDILPNIVYDLIASGLAQSVNIIHEGQVICGESLTISANFKLNQDSIIYLRDTQNNKPRKAAVFTHVYNPGRFLEVWSSYYAKIVGTENVYVLDHESTDGSVQRNSDLYQRIPVPRGELDHFNMSRFCSHFQRFLLSNYEWVIHTDCDEFLVTHSGPESFLNILDQFPKGGRFRPSHAIELLEAPGEDSPLDWDAPLCSQRKWCVENKSFLKPCLSSLPITWTPGFHHCFDEVMVCPDLWMVHAKWVCLDAHVHLNAAFRTQKQSDLDLMVFPLETTWQYQIQKDNAAASMAKKFSDSAQREALQEIPAWLKGQF